MFEIKENVFINEKYVVSVYKRDSIHDFYIEVCTVGNPNPTTYKYSDGVLRDKVAQELFNAVNKSCKLETTPPMNYMKHVVGDMNNVNK